MNEERAVGTLDTDELGLAGSGPGHARLVVAAVAQGGGSGSVHGR